MAGFALSTRRENVVPGSGLLKTLKEYIKTSDDLVICVIMCGGV